MIGTTENLKSGVRSIFRVFSVWRLTESEIRGILGFPFGTQLAEWKVSNLASMPADVVERVRVIGAIYKLLKNHPVPAPAWLRQSIPKFGGRTPLERLASGDLGDLREVYGFLKADRGRRAPADMQWQGRHLN